MTARAGMGTLINLVRANCNVGSADYTLNGVTYFSDDQIQAELDRVRQTYIMVDLELMPRYVDGAYEWKDFGIPQEIGTNLERDGIDSGFAVRDTNGGTVSGYSVNYEAGIVTFTNSQAGSVFRIDVRAYNMNRAAAAIWRWKAAHVANRVDWKGDNQQFSASEERKACLDMARYYAGQAGPVVSTFQRTDEV